MLNLPTLPRFRRIAAVAGLALTAPGGSLAAAELSVRVVDEDGAAVENVVVTVDSLDGHQTRTASAATTARAFMEQKDNRFVPHVLVVPTGTEVDFPNNDTVSHHVYSFSKPKSFELALYTGTAHPPVTFNEPGLVVLGCNIHDNMLGYILVVDTPYYAVSNADGTAVIDSLAAGTVSVSVWTPRLRARDLPETIEVAVQTTGRNFLEIRLTGRLRPPHSHGDGPLVWSHY